MWLFIEPLDVLLFRESKPFTAGESFWARSTFPPSPFPFMGAIRSKLMAENRVDFHAYKHAVMVGARRQSIEDAQLQHFIEQIGGPNDYGRLQITGLFLCKREGNTWQPYFPVPFDLLLLERDGHLEGTDFLRPQTIPWSFSWNPPSLTPLWTIESGGVAKGKTVVNTRNLKSYLEGGPVVPTDRRELWEAESRVGIELSGRRTAEKGKLYTLEFTRLNTQPTAPMGFLLEITGLEGLAFPDRGLLTLGGESRGASYEVVPDSTLSAEYSALRQGEALKERLCDQCHFKLYLATPALFRNGWFPDFLQEVNSQYVGQVGSLQIRLVSAAVQKAVPIGGWDLVHNRPRPMRKAVPAGSVYFFQKMEGQLTESDIETLFHAFHFKSLLRKGWEGGEQELSEEGKAGFGLALLGVWS